MRRARAVAAAGALLTLAAFVFDAAPLFVPGIAFALVGVLTPLWVWLSVRRSRVTRRIDAQQVLERQPIESFLEIRRGMLGLPGAEIHDQLSSHPLKLVALPTLIPFARTTEIRMVTRFERRGLQRLEPPLLAVRDPLGLAGVVRRGHGETRELLVLPRTEPVRWRGDARARRLLGPDSGSIDEPLAAVDVDGLRPYRQGTPASRIHWSALARGHGLLERRLSADGESRPLIVLDPRYAAESEHLDQAVRAAASLAVELARRGGCRVQLPGDGRAAGIDTDLRGWPALHVRLALVTSSAAGIPALAGHAGSAALFYVALRGPGRLPAALAGARAGRRILVAPAAVCDGAGTPAFSVAGCNGYVLGAGGGTRSRVDREVTGAR